MAYDGVTTRNMIFELNQSLINARIEKIFVPTKNDIVLSFHTQNRENVKLLISIDANNARIHFTQRPKENPIKAPQICMILRKHLQGAKLLSVTQYGLDRVIIFQFQNLNELGDLVEKKLMIELMGKYSNAILLNESNHIIDSMRHVDFSMSSVREVLPGKPYVYPSTMGKVNFESLSYEEFEKVLYSFSSEIYTDTMFSNLFVGFSKSFSHHFLDSLDCLEKEYQSERSKKIFSYLQQVFQTLKEHSVGFKMASDGKDYLLNFDEIATTPFLASNFLDTFYAQKESNSLIKMAKLNLKHEVESQLSKLNKKLDLASKTLSENQDYQKYKEYGELLNCHMHLIKIGMPKINVINFYDQNREIEIPLQIHLTPSRNAQNYFKKYTKAKNAMEHATAYIKEYKEDIDYLNSVLYELELADNLSEMDEIREELIQEKYLSIRHKKGKQKETPSAPLQFWVNQISILVGRNNLQNDKLTFKIAKKNDTWLHVKGFHGSHVIIESENVPDEVLLEAARLAVQYSEIKHASKVEVDYCLVKFVHKESGSKPGKVTYTDYHTIVI